MSQCFTAFAYMYDTPLVYPLLLLIAVLQVIIVCMQMVTINEMATVPGFLPSQYLYPLRVVLVALFIIDSLMLCVFAYYFVANCVHRDDFCYPPTAKLGPEGPSVDADDTVV